MEKIYIYLIYIMVDKVFDNTVFIFVIVCIITIIIIILVVWAVNKSKKAKEASQKIEWPPKDYMQDIGSKCPDYWSYVGVDKEGNPICENKFNIPVAKSQCMTNSIPGYKNVMSFTKIPKWPIKKGNIDSQIGDGNGTDYSKACNWIRNCGPTSTTSASWVGMNDMCP